MKLQIARLVLCAAALLAAPVSAQGWKPEKGIEILIGLTAGSSQDRTGRALQKAWQDANLMSVPVTVINRPGGGGQVAATVLLQHPGDGHYLLVISPTIVSRTITGLGTMQVSDFTPLALLGHQYLAAAVRTESALHSARDLTERLKRDPHTF